ncbi:MAG: aspartate aminotransferase family protein [Acutalibacteraceae bacterium]
MTFEEIKTDEQQYMMHTYGRFDAAIVSGKGAVAKDVNGKEYIDFTSGIGVNCLGYCDDGWVKAVSEQAATVQHISNLYYTPLQTEVSKKLCELTGFDKVFLCNSGAEANECAIKIARKYSFDKYGKGRQKIVTLVNSFHGRTVTTLAATGQDVFHNYFFPFTEGFDYAEANNIDDLKAHIKDDVCAVFIELVQGEGGVMPLTKEFVDAAAEICKENDILLMIDEVQTGMSRTGAVYCYQNYGIQPDVITSAKGLGGGVPIGACLCGKKLADVMAAGSHGTTFGGNPIACAAAKEVLSRVTTPEFLAEVREKGEYIRKELQKIGNVKEVRGMGMMIGIVTEKDNAKEIAKKCVESGLLILTAKNLLRLLPPLTITYEEIGRGIAILKKVMEA